MAAACLLLAACDYVEVERETGFKGKARVNPWLAAERYAAREGLEVKSVIGWTAPDWDDAVWLMPSDALANESFVRHVREWTEEGGHLVLLVEHASAERNDWSSYDEEPAIEPPLVRLLEEAGLTLDMSHAGGASAERIDFAGESFKVEAASEGAVSTRKGQPGVFASATHGEGRISVLMDARIFRNRWIGDHEHAALFDALIKAGEFEGAIGFMRGAGLSFMALLRAHLWPVLLALGLLIVLWLWKNLSRFGPLDAAASPQVLRGYESHLEALGDFQWRIDRAASLLAPLRQQVVELGQRASQRAGRRDDDFFSFLAGLAGIPRERVFRALAEPAPADSTVLTRTTADLQQLLQILQHSQRS